MSPKTKDSLRKEDQTERSEIGWKESIDFPEWGILNLNAKIDTGARRSAIDVTNIKELSDNRVQFDVALKKKDRSFTQTVTCPILHQTHVKSSNGQQHERYFVETSIVVGTVEKRIELSLVCRKKMSFRMLLGRKALEPEFIVDPSRAFIAGKRRKTKLMSPLAPNNTKE